MAGRTGASMSPAEAATSRHDAAPAGEGADRAAAAHPPLPIVVGCPRSGTSLLAVMLDSHPQLAIPPETEFLVPATRLAGAGDALRRRLFEVMTVGKEGASTWIDCGLDAEAFRRRLEAVEPFRVADGVRAFYAMYAERQGKARCGDKKPHYVGALPAIGALLPEAHFVHIIRDPRDTI